MSFPSDMTAPPAGALEACLALLEKATPGPWKVFETEIPHYGKSGPHIARNIYTEWKHPQLQSEYPIVCQATGIGATKEGQAVQFTNISPDNASALVAAVNLLRTHGPALLAALRLREWRPIAEAPKDGTEVLLCGPKWIAAGIGSWDKHALPHKGDWVDDTGALFSPTPTAYMPLPAPPTADDLASVLEESATGGDAGSA